MGWPGTACLLSILAGVLALPGLVWWPLAFVLPGIYLAMTLAGWYRIVRIARARNGESICDFVRSFDCRAVDTWIIRAVYEQLSDQFPIRSSDSLERDLGINDDEELYDCITDIAGRIGRSLDTIEPNPVQGKIATVQDLVLFLQYQPRVAAR